MAVILLGSFASGRRYDFPTALAFSALALCLLNTSTVFDVGAQLTYACSLGVYLAAPPQLTGVRRNRRRAFVSLVCWGTFGAWLFSSPILINSFHRLVLSAGVANLVAVPLSVALLYLGLLAIGLGLIWMPLAVPLCWVARLLLDSILHVNAFCASLPLAGLDNIVLPAPLVALWYLVVILAFWALRSQTPWELTRGLNWRRVAAVAAGVVCVGAVVVSLSARPTQRLEMDVLDVGAGQCVLLRAPGGADILLDAGTEARGNETAQSASRVVLPFLALQGVRSLEAIVLSHPHDDHCNLAAEIMQAIPTRQLLVGPDAGAEASWPAILQVARERGVSVVAAQAGGTLPLAPDCRLEFLEPTQMLTGTDDDSNNNSLVERLVYRQVRVLLPADLQAEGEGRLVQNYAPEALHAQVLLAAHHASVHSGTREFIQAVAPEVVLISCGSGSRRPRPEALRVFEDLGLPIWRTDVSGTISLSTDGRRVKVRRYRR
jgi:competence protein ComEC